MTKKERIKKFQKAIDTIIDCFADQAGIPREELQQCEDTKSLALTEHGGRIRAYSIYDMVNALYGDATRKEIEDLNEYNMQAVRLGEILEKKGLASMGLAPLNLSEWRKMGRPSPEEPKSMAEIASEIE